MPPPTPKYFVEAMEELFLPPQSPTRPTEPARMVERPNLTDSNHQTRSQQFKPAEPTVWTRLRKQSDSTRPIWAGQIQRKQTEGWHDLGHTWHKFPVVKWLANKSMISCFTAGHSKSNLCNLLHTIQYTACDTMARWKTWICCLKQQKEYAKVKRGYIGYCVVILYIYIYIYNVNHVLGRISELDSKENIGWIVGIVGTECGHEFFLKGICKLGNWVAGKT